MTGSEPEPKVAAELESELAVVDERESEPEIEKFLEKTSVDLPAEFSIELVSSTPAMIYYS